MCLGVTDKGGELLNIACGRVVSSVQFLNLPLQDHGASRLKPLLNICQPGALGDKDHPNLDMSSSASSLQPFWS